MLSVNKNAFTFTITAGEDLDDLAPGTGDIYKAVAVVDGQVAANGEEASGILVAGGKSGEFVTLAGIGESKYTAGDTVTIGAQLTCAASGYITAAASGDAIVGQALEAATSGSVVRGLFSFGTGVTLS